MWCDMYFPNPPVDVDVSDVIFVICSVPFMLDPTSVVLKSVSTNFVQFVQFVSIFVEGVAFQREKSQFQVKLWKYSFSNVKFGFNYNYILQV